VGATTHRKWNGSEIKAEDESSNRKRRYKEGGIEMGYGEG
jgi:hypothetical protein